MVLQAKEYETASGKIQLQFVELLGCLFRESVENHVEKNEKFNSAPYSSLFTHHD